jgi:integrase
VEDLVPAGRQREYLTDAEVQRLAEAAKGHRHATMILVAYRHGLRASELTDLRWGPIEFSPATLHVTFTPRLKCRPAISIPP